MNHAEGFTKGFAGYVCVGDTIETKVGRFTVRARIEHDDETSIDDDDMHRTDPKHECYAGAPEGEYARAMRAREAYFRDEWKYVGVVLSVHVGDVTLDEHAASLWGIEMNYPREGGKVDNSYLLEVANDLLPDALNVAESRRLKYGSDGRPLGFPGKKPQFEEKHTPGPWEVDDGGDGELEVWAPETGYMTIALCSGTEPSKEEEANARLIAAAPDLHASLVEILDGFWHYVEEANEGHPEMRAIVDAARKRAQDALTKARGAN